MGFPRKEGLVFQASIFQVQRCIVSGWVTSPKKMGSEQQGDSKKTAPQQISSDQDIQSIARQCLDALDFLHGNMRLTHTDLKLENVGGAEKS